MKKLNFITNIPADAPSGGWSGMSRQVRRQLDRHFTVHVVQGITPPYPFLQVQASRIARGLGLRGPYPAFAESRLMRVKELVRPLLQQDADLDFFHGATTWLSMDHPRPYAFYLDACFATYMNVYQDPDRFSRSQLRRLMDREAAMLDKAEAVFFSSAWSMEDAKAHYGLSGSRFHVAGLGGGWNDVEPAQAGEPPYFLFVGLDFMGKGGETVVKAFSKLSERYMDVRLKIVGQEPPASVLRNGHIEYLGFISQSDPAGLASMKELYRKALAFVMPTGRDMTPLVLLEAGSAGCPVISTRKFGIPEMVEDGVSGLLLHDGDGLVEELALAMSRMLDDPKKRAAMGKAARDRVSRNFNWDFVGDRIAAVLDPQGRTTALN